MKAWRAVVWSLAFAVTSPLVVLWCVADLLAWLFRQVAFFGGALPRYSGYRLVLAVRALRPPSRSVQIHGPAGSRIMATIRRNGRAVKYGRR